MSVEVDTPIQFLKGVGPRLAEVLRKRDINTISDFLEWYPRAYEDRRVARNIASLVPGELVSLKAQVLSVRSFNLGRSRRRAYDVVVRDSTGKVHCKYFRIPYKGYFERFRPGQWVRVVGKVGMYRNQIQFHHPDIRDDEKEDQQVDALLPIYTETEGLSPYKIRKLMSTAIDKVIIHPEGDFSIDDKLPEWIQREYKLKSRAESIRYLHQPPQQAGQEFSNFTSPYHRRLIFEEFFWLELFLASRRAGIKKEKAPEMAQNMKLVNSLRESLPFELTGGQQQAFEQIRKDLTQPHPMHRLIQGDVGSGKTVVALMAAAFAADSGFQSCIMVPTEILAEQHYKNARKLLEPLGINIGFLTGQIKAGEKKQQLAMLKSGLTQVCIGTHALIQDEVEFAHLALVIIDEQHRFGVHQRQKLKTKGYSPHFLVMTATPIPRTLAMTVYGDLDVSLIREMPKGRQPIVTRVVFENKRAKVMGFLRDQIVKGRQVYLVYPLVEESEKIDLKNALTEFESIQVEFPQFRVGLLHGKMKADEKESIMREFRAHELDILVATTVIEVGVDVPNANMMVVEHAERFGLSQLHQLRGRVGRGSEKSYCVFMLGRAVSDEARERTKIMESTNDGFKVAEADLEIRGPGEFLGSRQSGLPGFKMANLVRDVEVLQQAREAAFKVFARDPKLSLPEHAKLREELVRTKGGTSLASVG